MSELLLTSEAPDPGLAPLEAIEAGSDGRVVRSDLAESCLLTTASSSDFGWLFSSYASELCLSAEDCESSGPRIELRKVAGGAGPIEQISQFARAGAELYFEKLRRQLGRRPVVSGVRFWGLFCGVTDRPRLPPPERGLLAWPSFFITGRFSKIYVARVERACILLGLPMSRETESVITVGRGLAKIGVETLARILSLTKGQPTQPVLAKGWNDRLTLIDLISRTFSLRAPVGNACPRRGSGRGRSSPRTTSWKEERPLGPRIGS